MIDVIDNKYFYLHNKEVAYLFDLLPNQQLEHLYYGEDLGKLSKNDLEYMSLHPNKASGTVKFSKKNKKFDTRRSNAGISNVWYKRFS